MDTILQDIRFAARTLFKNGWFTLIAVVCLALGIGVNTAVFSVTNSVILRPFPYRAPHELVMVTNVHERRGEDRWSMSFADFTDMKAQSRSFADMAAYYERSITLTGANEAERVSAAQVTTNTFKLLGLTPLRGRTFLPEDGNAGAPRVTLLSHGLWERRFGADSSIVGTTLTLSGEPYTVIGIMQPGLNFPEVEEIWVPIRADTAPEARDVRYYDVIGRLRPGVSEEQATAEVAAIAKRLQREYPKTNENLGARVRTLHHYMLGDNVYLVIYLMQGSVAFVLLIACANVANLLLARATGRERELAVRTALGAGRGRLVRQLLTESVLLSLLGGALGVLVAMWTVQMIDSLIPKDDLPFWMYFGIEPNALVFTIVAAVLTGLLFGVLPAMQMSRANVNEALKEGGRGTTTAARSHRLRNVLVVGEIALSLILLAGAGLMIKSFMRMAGEEPGFDTKNILTMRVSLPGTEFDSVGIRAQTYEEIVTRVAALPGVVSASYVNLIPLTDDGSRAPFIVEGKEFERGTEPVAELRFASVDYFRTLGIQLRSGRLFTQREAIDTVPVVIVSDALARRYWPSGDALGRRLRLVGDSTAPWLTVVGVIPDMKHQIDDPRDQMSLYIPYGLMQWRSASLVIRTSADPATLAPSVRREVRNVHPVIPTFNVRTLDEARRRDMWPFRLYGAIFGLFAWIAMVLAAIGVYGVMAYGVTQRTHEIGVRMALGARQADVLRLVVRQGLLLTIVGLTIGLVGALAVTGSMQSLLYGITTTDPMTYVFISVILAGVAVVASYVPARRATRVDPMIALRTQ